MKLYISGPITNSSLGELADSVPVVTDTDVASDGNAETSVSIEFIPQPNSPANNVSS